MKNSCKIRISTDVLAAKIDALVDIFMNSIPKMLREKLQGHNA